jgi:DNA-binding GntR family transcriptional regulator
VSTPAPLARTTTVDALAAALRTRILDGDLAPDAPLREQHLAEAYGVARHTVRAALRALATEGLARVEPHRGARVTALTADDLEELGALRIALEVEGARLVLARHGGRLPATVRAAQAGLEAACAAHGSDGPAGFAAVAEAHEALHHAIVAASGSARIAAAHRALGGELRLFLTQLRPAWDVPAIAADHAALVDALEAEGPEALRPHIEASTRALVAHLG